MNTFGHVVAYMWSITDMFPPSMNESIQWYGGIVAWQLLICSDVTEVAAIACHILVVQ